jgi:alanine-glyoxylate transaminase/serine-glyoxylate transaminase/serine-pyruvate transaminase
MTYRPGRLFVHVPGPTNVPGTVLAAIASPTVDHRGPSFPELTREVLAGLAEVAGTRSPAVVYPCSGTGAWEAALVNTLSPGDLVVAHASGHFASGWADLAESFGIEVERLPGDWRRPLDADALHAHLSRDRGHRVRAVLVVHNETSTGVTTPIASVRRAMDQARHPALLLVDTISSLGSIEYRHDDWGVDVTVGASQKGLMLPPGLGFNVVGPRAQELTSAARLPRAYWDWRRMLEANAGGYFPYTPSTNLLFGLRQALSLLRAEGLPHVYTRHERHGRAVRRAVEGWGLKPFCTDPRAFSATVTAVMVAGGRADDVVREAAQRVGLALGVGLGETAGRVFRIGHLGDLNDPMLLGALAGVELALRSAGVACGSGVSAAADQLASTLAD